MAIIDDVYDKEFDDHVFLLFKSTVINACKWVIPVLFSNYTTLLSSGSLSVFFLEDLKRVVMSPVRRCSTYVQPYACVVSVLRFLLQPLGQIEFVLLANKMPDPRYNEVY